MLFRVLSVFPSEITTRIGIFDGDSEIMRREIRHDKGELSRYKTIGGQLGHRRRAIEESLKAWRPHAGSGAINAVVVPACASLRLPGGVYAVNAGFLEHAKGASAHDCALDLGPPLAEALAGPRNARGFAIASISGDELEPFSLVTGLPELSFGRAADTLNIQHSLHRFSEETGRPVSEFSVIVADLGRNFLICSCREGRMLDLSDSSERGPFSLSKSGSVPAAKLVSMAYSGMWSMDDLAKNVNVRGGVEGYVGNVDLDGVMKRYDEGDAYAGIVARNLAYQTAQEISAQATVLRGNVDAVILTGISAENAQFIELVMDRIGWIPGEKVIYPGEDDLRAMAHFAASVLSGSEEALICG
ncbi:MAG: butyrate kinase [Synergistaceae bacterium]|nr:butyrate kinase [Synergistaceae bacterium]